MFTDDLGMAMGRHADREADRIREALNAKGIEVLFGGRTNQIFIKLTEAEAAALSEKVAMGFWEHTADGGVIERIATSWATDPKETEAIIAALQAPA